MALLYINDYTVVRREENADINNIPDAHLYQHVIDTATIDRNPQVGWIFDKKTGALYPNIAPVTPRQIRQALILSGISLSLIDSALDSLPEPTRSLALAEWEYSNEFQRNRPLVSNVAQLLGWTEDQIDALWIFAGTL